MKISDLRVYWKFLSRNKLYTFVSVFGFSISLMFVIILGMYVREQLSVDDFQEKKDRIFLMTHDGDVTFGNTVAPFVKEKFPEVESYVRMHGRGVDVGKKGSEKIKASALYADSTFFNVFTIPLIEGNASQVLQSHKSVVVSMSFANKYFPDKAPVGSTLVINNKDYTITGLMEDIPRNTMLPNADLIFNYNNITDHFGGDWVINTSDNFGFIAFLLEKEGADLRKKTPMMLDLFKKEFWYYKREYTSDLQLIPLKEAYFKIKDSGFNELKHTSLTMVTVYSVIAILILVIALLNYINLTVAQASFRGKEAAIKKLIGSSRRRLIMQLLGESLIMTAFTFILGLLLAFLTEPFFKEVLNMRSSLSDMMTGSVIATFILFIFVIAFIAGVLPALFISSFNPIEIVKGTFSHKVKTIYSKALIVFQYTIAIVLLICSFFVKEQVDYLINYDMGFNREGILEMPFIININEINGLKSKLQGIPGVELVSFTNGTPLNGGNNMSYEYDGQQISLQEIRVDSTFFKIFAIPIAKETGIPATTETVWLNKKAYYALTDTTTQTADIGWLGKKQVAGIIKDFNIRTLHNETGMLMLRYRPNDHWPWNVVVKLSLGADYYKTAKRIEEEYSRYSGGEIIEAKFIDDQIQQNYEKERKTSDIMTAFTILTIIIMIMGVFAMSLYIIRQKQKEISIRKVNGATEIQILTMLNWDSFKRVLIAFIIACPIAYYFSGKWLEEFPYRVSIDWWAFALAGLIVFFLTFISVSWMAWSAARTNPIEFLKRD
ncbi:MAG: FtsX-like permease family protein [Dysgonomonas sp.]|nr:FtsX-like permease family protein [Dysgonomonas sp.]